MSGSMVEVLKTTPRMGRRSMALADIDPKYVSQSGIWEASEVETSKGSIRIQHLTAVATSLRSVTGGSGATSIVGGPQSNPRFPKLEECAHFHYDYVELPVLKIVIREDTSKSISLPTEDAVTDKCAFAIEVSAGGQSWVIRRTHANFILLDEQLHRCVWDRSFSRLEQLKESLAISSASFGSSSAKTKRHQANSCANINIASSSSSAASTQCSRRRTTSAGGAAIATTCLDLEVVGEDGEDNNSRLPSDHPDEEHCGCKDTITQYLSRLAQLPTNKITCGTVLSWLELDNRGRHIVSSDDSDINTPAVAAACAVRKYLSQATDEISFEVGDMISVIDMPPPEESIWWRGKRGFHVGFFPRECVQVIGDKVPAGLPIVSSVRRLQRLSVSSTPSTSSSTAPEKPVLRKHGKLIAFFRSFILSRPSRRRLKQSGILRERVFSCDLAEHLLNTGNDIPAVLKCCAEFIEKRGIVDGIYRLSGITSNIQKLRNLFDEDKTPNLEEDAAIKQDIHAVSSLLKMYFRELPNPLCTYQLYDKFVAAAQASDEERLFRMREVVHELPPPHYRTLEYLMKHLARVAQRSGDTGMTPKNMAIVWAPNLIRCKELEAGGVDALKGIGVQAVVTEYLVRHADLIFNDKLPANYSITTTVLSHKASCSASGRPKSLAISSPIRLMSLEEAQDRLKQDDRKYIEVGGGPASLPPKYHTVIDLPSRRSALKNKRSPIGWRQFFSRNRSFSKPSSRKPINPIEITVMTKSMPTAGPQGIQTNWAGRLRPVKSVESLVSSPMYTASGSAVNGAMENSDHNGLDHESILEDVESNLSKSSPATPVMTDVDILFHAAPMHTSQADSRCSLQNPKTHNRSISHDSYFEFGEFRNSNRVYIDETLEEETLSQSSKLSLEISSGGESPTRKTAYTKDSTKTSRSSGRGDGMMSPVTPPPSAASLVVPATSNSMMESVTSTSSDDVVSEQFASAKSPLLPSKWRDSEVQTSQTQLYDVGVSTQEDMEQCANASVKMVSSSTATSFASSGQQTATNSTGYVVTRDSSVQSLISHSSSGCDNIYELDRNSSVDESSVDSTPCEPFATTNIIYSPLVDDLSSPASSGDHFKSQMEQFRVSSDSDATSTTKAGSRLYVCPLYEAGVSTVESLSSAVSGGTEMTEVSSTMSVSPRGNPPRNNQYENVSLINTNANKSPNLQVFLCSSSQSLNTPVNHETPDSSSHAYENQRFYENQPPPVPAIRKSKSEGAVMMTSLNATCNVQKVVTPQQSPTVQPEPVKQSGPNNAEDTDSIYDKEHYENISEVEATPSTMDAPVKMRGGNINRDHCVSYRESNIYEDIDDDDDDDLHSGNKYETVEFEKGTMKNISNLAATTTAVSDDEYEKVQDCPVIIHHHYAEIEERMDTSSASPDLLLQEQPQFPSTTTVVIGPSSPDKIKPDLSNTNANKISVKNESVESSPSHSHTDDMVTYLEVQTPHLHLRNNSLDSQEEISQQSSNGGCPKLGKTNSADSSDTPGGNSPAADEGEIRHIDSPLSSPTANSAPSAGVNNPLYGIEGEVSLTSPNETKEMDLQSDDGEEEISVNESLSISISMDETPKTKQNRQSDPKPSGIGTKLVSRCNSAPLAVGVHEFTVAFDRSLDNGGVNGAAGDHTKDDDEVFHKSKMSAARSNSSMLGRQTSDESEKRFGEKILLCKRLSEPSLLFSNHNISNTNCLIANSATSQKTDSSNNNSSGSNGGGGASPAAWKIADAKRLANRKQSVRELLSKFESKDSNCSTSPVQSQSPPSSLPPTGLTSNPNNNKEYGSLSSTGRSPSNSSISSSFNTGLSIGGGSGRFPHHRFSTGDILMTQSVSAVENLGSITSSASGSFTGVQNTNSMIVRSDTFPELSRDDSSTKENAMHGAFSVDRNNDDQEKCPALRVAMSSVDMNDPSRRERIEKYKEERRSFLRQKINSELTAQQKSPTDGAQQLVSLKSPVSDVSDSEHSSLVCSNRVSESPRKRAFSEDSPTGVGVNTTNKSIKTDPFSLKCAFLSSSTTTTSCTKVTETSLNPTGDGGLESVSSSTIVSSMTKSETAEEINVRERVAMWSSSSPTSQSSQKKENQQCGGNQRVVSSTATMTHSTSSSSISSTSCSLSSGGHASLGTPVSPPKHVGAISTSTTEFPKASKPVLRRELTTSAIEVSKSKLTKVGRTNSEGTKKIKDMAAFFEAKQF